MNNSCTKSQSNDTAECCCGPAAKDNIVYKPVKSVGTITTVQGVIEKISTVWSFWDYVGWVGVRFGINRMEYAVKPGLYAVGSPSAESPVLVTANYKLTFDVLRKELDGLDVWIMVIDTKGINVWCAAGKGTFGTMEIVKRIGLTGLEKIVSGKKIVLPQLGAPGVSAHIVSGFSGFKVLYGPVRAQDIKKYLKSGMKADADMRRVQFGIKDRLAVSWMEFALSVKPVLIISMILLSVGYYSSFHFIAPVIWQKTLLAEVLLLGAVVSGSVLNAIMLPILPGKAFSFKGGVLGSVAAALIILASGYHLHPSELLTALLLSSAVSAYVALNYTGASTFTSRSGVDKEMKYALPAIFSVILAAVTIQLMRFI